MNLLILSISLLFSNSASFCSCLELNDLSNEGYKNYDLIVQGQVTSIEYVDIGKIIILGVKKTYKGEVTGNIVKISSPSTFSYCGLNIGTGGKWILYASEEDGIYRTNSCTPSSSLPPMDFQKERVR